MPNGDKLYFEHVFLDKLDLLKKLDIIFNIFIN